jgi:hypothetical protein
VVVLIVGAVAEVERPLVVDLHEHDRPVRVTEAREDLAERVEPARRLVVESVARIARHRERQRRHREHDGVAVRRERLARRVPDDALGDAEERQLGVDMRAGPKDDLEASRVRHLEEPRDVEARVRLPEVEPACLDLMNGPGDVDVDETEPHRLHRVEAGPPLGGRVTPVVHRARVQRQDRAAAEVETARVETDARRLRGLGLGCARHRLREARRTLT